MRRSEPTKEPLRSLDINNTTTTNSDGRPIDLARTPEKSECVQDVLRSMRLSKAFQNPLHALEQRGCTAEHTAQQFMYIDERSIVQLQWYTWRTAIHIIYIYIPGYALGTYTNVKIGQIMVNATYTD